MRHLMRRTAVTAAAVAGAAVLAGCSTTGMAAGAAPAAMLTATEAALPANAGPAPRTDVPTVSCASAGNCTAVGSYAGSPGDGQGLLLTQTSGTWAAGIQAPLPGNAAPNPHASLTSVSCTSPGHCTAVGGYTDRAGHDQGLLLTRTSGTWAAAEAPEPGNAGPDPQAGLISVRCASAGNCTAVSDYTDNAGHYRGLLVTQTSGTTPKRSTRTAGNGP